MKLPTIAIALLFYINSACSAQIANSTHDSLDRQNFKRPIAGNTWYMPKLNVEWTGLYFGDMTASEFAKSDYFQGKTKESMKSSCGEPIKELDGAMYFRFFPKNAIPNPDCPLYIVFLFDKNGIYSGFDIEVGEKQY